MAFAGVLAFATVVAGFAAALTLALVLAFACVFAFFSISHRLEGDPSMARCARCIGTHGEGPSQEAGNRRPSDYGLGWFNHVITFLCMFGVLLVFLREACVARNPADAWFFRFACAPTWSEEVGCLSIPCSYLSNYDNISGWNLVPGWLEDREILAVFPHPHDARPGYFVELTVVDGRVTAIRDFRYEPYVMREAMIKLVR